MSPPVSFDLASRFLERSRYYLGVEYPAKIRHVVHAIPGDALWARANEQSNSIGNLMLHLSGNVRQWIVSGVGGAPDVRRRDLEFAVRGKASGSELLEQLEKTLSETDAVLAQLATAALSESRDIQGRSTTCFGAIYHVVEHFSTHTGQIVLLGKQFAPGALHFYDDEGGLVRPTFLGDGRSDID